MITVAIGSTNPAKVAAAERAARRVWPGMDIIAVAVPSGVREQPLSDDETVRGAINRATAAQAITVADFGIGVEGGVQDTPFGMFVGGWAAVIDRHGTIGIGAGGRVQLPLHIAEQIRNGAELGPAMDRFSGRENVKHNLGAIGIFTGGLVHRTEALEMAIVYALARFIAPGNYQS